MPNTVYQRFAITVPEGMALQIEKACRAEGRNRSEFFREAARHYMSAKLGGKSLQFVMPSTDEDLQDNPFRLFSEWESEADAVYDILR